MDLLALIFPKEKKFYRMVEKQVDLVNSAVIDFNRFIENYDKLSPAGKQKIIALISLKEEKDDSFYTEMVKALKSTFITPIDREDLHQLVMTFEMIMDVLETITHKIDIYKIKKMDQALKKQTGIMVHGFGLIVKLIFSLNDGVQVEKISLKMRKLEQAGDDIYIKALDDLFSDPSSSLKIIKMKDLYSSLERIIDKIHEASLIIENIAVKYS